MTKQDLREKIKQIKNSSEYIKNSDGIIFNKITNLEVFKNSKVLFIYVSRENEVDTLKLINYAFSLGKIICIPKCFKNSEMSAYEIKSLKDLESGMFNILEPKKYCKEINKSNIDLAIIPCVACDMVNNRLGYGKGFYDRYLADFLGVKIGLCRKQLLQKKISVDKYDIKMDIVITD